MSFTAFKSIFFPRNGSNLNVLGLAAVCFIIASQVRGSDVIYGNYDPNNILQTISNGNASGPQFGVSSYNLSESVPFTTDNNMYTVDSVELVISRLFGNTSDLTLSLYSDAGGTPGSSLGTFSNPANITQGGALFTATGLTLAPDTTYWIIAAPGVSEKSDFEWWNSLATGISGFSQFDSNANAWARGLSAQLITVPRLWFMAHRCRSHQPSPCLALVPSLLVFCSVGTPDSLFLRLPLLNYRVKPVSYQYQKRTWPVV